MRVPLSWLREFVPVDVSAEALADKLSVSGFAVEEMIFMGRGISGVVVGEVRSMREHPNSDKLMLVKAFDGKAERDIVCGARNYAVGDRVPLALPGAKLPGGMEIAQRVVRGETSDGMLCSARELEISEDHAGILILDRDLALGADLVRALELDDVVLHLDITTNRPDALSIVGIAREVAALYKLPFAVPPSAVDEGSADVSSLASVKIDDARGCPRYLARVIENVTVGSSPWWMRRRLYAAGMRPISNVVDVTNYVLLERGQPLHAFDLDRLDGRAIVVRKPRKGESITTLDGVSRTLAKDDVLICDASRPVAVAGVMGGADSEVSSSTTRLLLESAYFDPIRIRPTARRLGLRTEASTRFERGADPEGVPAAADRAAALLASLAGGTVARGAIDAYPKPAKQRRIKLRVARASSLIGVAFDSGEIAGHLRALGCGVEASKSAVRATVPSWRPDLSIEEDLVEEVARLHGYDSIPEELPPGARAGGLSASQRLEREVRRIMLGAGVNEAQTQSLLSPSLADTLRLPDDAPLRRAARIGNPLSEEESLLRPALVPGLLLALQRNVARHVVPVSLFEIGTVFRPSDANPQEHRELAWVMCGPARTDWHGSERELDFFDARGVLEALLSGVGIRDVSLDDAGGSPDLPPILHPGRAARVTVGGEAAGHVGELSPDACSALDVPHRIAAARLDLAVLLRHAGGSVVNVPARVPATTRDVAVVVPDGTVAADVQRTIAEAGGRLLERIELFDVYRGAQAGEGNASLAFALTLRDPERTLTDADADEALNSVTKALAAKGWTVRG